MAQASTMTPEQKRLYVRHILLPEIGQEGQAALCAASFDQAPEDEAGPADAVRSRYLKRAGLQGDGSGDDVQGDDVQGDDVQGDDVQGDRLLDTQRGNPVDAVRGAFEAVEVIKRVLEVGTPGSFPAELFE